MAAPRCSRRSVDESTERRGQSCRCDVIATRLLRFRFERGCGNRVYGGGERQTIAATMNYATVAYSLNSFRITVASINTCALIVCSPCKPGRRRAARAPVQSGALEGSQRRLTRYRTQRMRMIGRESCASRGI